MYKGKAINLLLAEDIERCENYLSDHSDEALGQKLYIDITSRYDGIISGLGNGLYQYSPDFHFYDPEVSGESLIHNLRVLCGRMQSYLATHYPATEMNSSGSVK